MRRAPRLDANHRETVRALRQIGASVQTLASLGDGAPDLLIGFRGVNALLEVKDGDKPPSARRLTEDEADWHAGWRGQVIVVHSAAEAVRYVESIQ